MDKRIGIGIVVALLVGGGFLATRLATQESSTQIPTPSTLPTQPKPTQSERVDVRAGFAIFTHGTFRVFTASMYHNLSPDVYIEAKNPNIIIVKKRGMTWGDFFNTLPMKLTKDCLTTGTKETFCTGRNGTLKFYLNDVKEDNLLDLLIHNGDRALITFGNIHPTQLKNQLQKVPIVPE